MAKTKVAKSKLVIVVCVAIVLAGGAFAIWFNEHKSTPKPASYSPEKVNTGASTKSPQSSTAKTGTTSPAPQQQSVSTPDHPVGTTLGKPTGSAFNKSPISLSSNDPVTSPSMESTCQTVFGALCGLRLTAANGTIKQVTPTAVNNQGASVIDWNAKTIGLTPGVWKVQLMAQKDGQTSLGDAYNLTVNQ